MNINSENAPSRRVLIVGLGISGNATALRLHQAGWQPVIIEKASARRGGGYFVGLFGAGAASAERLGVLDGMHDRKDPNGKNWSVDREGNRSPGAGFSDLPGKPRLLLRGDVEQALHDDLPNGLDIRFSTIPTHIEQDADGVDVTLRNTSTGVEVTERFALVVGADGLRSTVRALAFGPHEQFLMRLNCMIAAFELPETPSDLAAGDGETLAELGRSYWVFPFKDHAPTGLFSYVTDDVDAEFRVPPAQRVREVFGSPAGSGLEEAFTALEAAEAPLFDSVEQVHMDSWHTGRVVLVGDSAWCVTLYAGMGVSSGLAGADLLGTMLERYPDDIDRALTEWEAVLRPSIEYYQGLGLKQRQFFTPANRGEIAKRKLLMRLKDVPVVSGLLGRLQKEDSHMKELDIAAA